MISIKVLQVPRVISWEVERESLLAPGFFFHLPLSEVISSYFLGPANTERQVFVLISPPCICD